MSATRPEVSIVIKALNEERHIAAAIESALAALAGMSGEVILADSLSADRTIEIAAQYPIKIVSLSGIEDRSCGAGAQLAYQHSAGRYICLIDGDMRLHRGFLSAALQFLRANPAVAGVGGLIIERETGNLEYVKRADAQDVNLRPGEVSHLACGGVYRREAIESVGYLGDRNLHSAEELELGIRLGALGWKLARIGVPAIDHYGHSGNPYRLQWRRLTTGYAFGGGELLRATFGRRRSWPALTKLWWILFFLAAMHLWWLSLLATPFFMPGRVFAAIAIAMLAALPIAVMAVRCRSINLGVYSIVAWNVYVAGMWPGLLRPRVDPAHWIDSVVIKSMPVRTERTNRPADPTVKRDEPWMSLRTA